MQTKFTELTDSQWEVIEKKLESHRPRKHDLRVIVNAILWITRVGAQWRNLESKYPPWQSVYYYFWVWSKKGLWDELLAELVQLERKRVGREALPSRLAIDSQTIKSVAFVDEDTKGVDGGKKIKGRKRHIVVDSMGLLIAIFISRADMHDGQAGIEMLWLLDPWAERLELILGDSAYGGEFEEVAKGVYGWQVDTSQRPPGRQGFVPQKGRWQVERSFGWLNFFRRLAKDYEKTTLSAQAFVQLAFITVILNRMG